MTQWCSRQRSGRKALTSAAAWCEGDPWRAAPASFCAFARHHAADHHLHCRLQYSGPRGPERTQERRAKPLADRRTEPSHRAPAATSRRRRVPASRRGRRIVAIGRRQSVPRHAPPWLSRQRPRERAPRPRGSVLARTTTARPPPLRWQASQTAWRPAVSRLLPAFSADPSIRMRFARAS
jgi:hypothetical protein